MGKKRVLCGYGIDIDAVAGWLGSYGGEDSTSDISRGIQLKSFLIDYFPYLTVTKIYHRSLCWHSRHPPPPEASRQEQDQSYMVHSRPFLGDFPGGMCHDQRRRP